MTMPMPVLTPHGALILKGTSEASALEPARLSQLEKSFAQGTGHGLLYLGADEVGTVLSPELSYWREFGARYVTALCVLPGIGAGAAKPPVPIPASGELDEIAASAPPMTGAEYLTGAVLADLWRSMDSAFDAELAEAKLPVQEFLKGRHPAWNLVGRVHFNLAENRKDEDFPFAFLATYTTRLSAVAKAQHLPLGKALQEYAGAKNRARLLSLLMPVQRAAERCSWLKAMVDAGEIFHPLRWSPQQALQLLTDVPTLESAGVVVRATDPAKRNAKPSTGEAEKLRAVPETAIGSVRETLKEQGLPSGGNVTFVQARTAHEIAKAHLARLKLQERKGELIDRARATSLVFRLAREERDAWANWPARTAALMAAALGVDVHAMQTLLDTHVRAHLGELAELRPEFR